MSASFAALYRQSRLNSTATPSGLPAETAESRPVLQLGERFLWAVCVSASNRAGCGKSGGCALASGVSLAGGSRHQNVRDRHQLNVQSAGIVRTGCAAECVIKFSRGYSALDQPINIPRPGNSGAEHQREARWPTIERTRPCRYSATHALFARAQRSSSLRDVACSALHAAASGTGSAGEIPLRWRCNISGHYDCRAKHYLTGRFGCRFRVMAAALRLQMASRSVRDHRRVTAAVKRQAST